MALIVTAVRKERTYSQLRGYGVFSRDDAELLRCGCSYWHEEKLFAGIRSARRPQVKDNGDSKKECELDGSERHFCFGRLVRS